MITNVYDLIVSETPALAERLNENENVSAFLMSVYSQLLNIALDSPNDPKDLICQVDVIHGRLFRIRVSYYKEASAIHTDIGSKQPVTRNLNLVKFLQVNRNVKNLAQRAVEVIERWVGEYPATKQQGFKNVKLLEGKLLRGSNIFTAEMVVHYEYEEFVNAKLKWNLSDEEQLVEKGQVQ